MSSVKNKKLIKKIIQTVKVKIDKKFIQLVQQILILIFVLKHLISN